MKFHIQCLRHGEKHVKDILAVGICCCLETCKSVANVLVMWLVLGQGLMAISTTGILLLLCRYISPL